jgi:hypothetical protein
MTADMDIVVEFGRNSLTRLVEAFESEEYRPGLPVPARDLVDARRRATWIAGKHLVVFTSLNPRVPHQEVDVRLKSRAQLKTPIERNESPQPARFDSQSRRLMTGSR